MLTLVRTGMAMPVLFYLAPLQEVIQKQNIQFMQPELHFIHSDIARQLIQKYLASELKVKP